MESLIILAVIGLFFFVSTAVLGYRAIKYSGKIKQKHIDVANVYFTDDNDKRWEEVVWYQTTTSPYERIGINRVERHPNGCWALFGKDGTKFCHDIDNAHNGVWQKWEDIVAFQHKLAIPEVAETTEEPTTETVTPEIVTTTVTPQSEVKSTEADVTDAQIVEEVNDTAETNEEEAEKAELELGIPTAEEDTSALARVPVSDEEPREEEYMPETSQE